MAKRLNCCGEADHMLFCNHYDTLLTYSNTKYSISTPNNLYPICRTLCAKKGLQSVAHVVTMMMEDPSLRTAQETQQTLTEVLLSKAAVLNVSKV